LAFIPASALGRAQLLYLVFLWWMVIGNFERAVVAFAPQRLITEGVIFLNAVVCTLLVLTRDTTPTYLPEPNWRRLLRATVIAGTLASVLSIVVNWGVTRAIYGDRFAGYAAKHIRPERHRHQGKAQG
jgi:hypothetical protein